MPFICSLPNERRKLARSPEPVALTLFETERPFWKKSRTLFGFETQGAG
jgi:hypothetical protein